MAKQTRQMNLKNFIKKSLDENGELNKIRAALRSKILNLMRDGDKSMSFTNFTANQFGNFNFINELILEYFRYIGFNYSHEIFAAEVGMDVKECDEMERRVQLEKNIEKLSPIEINKDVPLLLNLLKSYLNFDE